MEVGWYLRLSRAPRVEALVDAPALPALEDQRAMNPSWSMDVDEAGGGGLRVVFTREARGGRQEAGHD
ncbi:hypothetical protein [Desulfocurvus vexinensis]|uniref:hypothetical protein n=1 Tax=Desulfocurvus vexinensis TaxID=399548 RepID=UPI0009FBA664|nr:hypothetical protein [Desulfocurvus vexinensis]